MSVVTGPRTVPSIPVQVLRAAVGTLAAVALVAGAVWGWGYAGPWAGDRWASAFGDPAMHLVDGVALGEAPVRSAVVTIAPSSLDGVRDRDALAAAFGTSSQELTDRAAIARELGHGATVAEVASFGPTARWLRTPVGLVVWSPAADGSTPLVSVRGTGSVVARTPAERATLLRRWVDALGITSGAAGPALALDVTESAHGSGTRVEARWRLVGAPPAQQLAGAVDTASFDAQGHLLSALVSTEMATAVRPVLVESPAAAWDDARHHRDAGYERAFPAQGSFGAPELAPGVVLEGPPGQTTTLPPTWWFPDGYGQPALAQAAAEVG